jgi:hypothetical protein
MKTLSICVLSICTVAVAIDGFPFREHPAHVFLGKPAAPRLETVLARQHKTAIRNGTQHGPNFAGHYTVVDWGCGTSCAAFVIVDALSGRVYEPPEISRGVDLGLDGPEYRRDSTLMVVANCPDPSVYGYKNCERKLYNWNGSRLVILKTEAVTPGNTAHSK